MIRVVATISLLTLAQVGWATTPQVGTITQIEGTVKIFTHPSKKIKGPAPHALFEKRYYSVRDAKIGDRVRKGNILRTAPGARAKVVFNNGDQFVVGPGTAYKVTWSRDSRRGDKAKTGVNLLYGKVRAIVKKGGPRSKLRVKTRVTTMGVRGTDFFVADGGFQQRTEVSVIRGTLTVKHKNKKRHKVKAGYTADVAETPVKEKAPKVVVRQTTKQEFRAIDRSSTIKTEPNEGALKSKEALKEVKKLEKKAVETTLADIRQYNPDLFKEVKKRKIASVTDLNSTAIEKLQAKAPEAPKDRKPYISELDNLDEEAYKKYFKIVE